MFFPTTEKDTDLGTFMQTSNIVVLEEKSASYSYTKNDYDMEMQNMKD